MRLPKYPQRELHHVLSNHKIGQELEGISSVLITIGIFWVWSTRISLDLGKRIPDVKA